MTFDGDCRVEREADGYALPVLRLNANNGTRGAYAKLTTTCLRGRAGHENVGRRRRLFR